MASSKDFVAFVEDLFSAVGPVRARSMFGGHGLYLDDVMFGLVDEDEVFLKTDAETQQRFLDAGCRRWIYEGGGRRMETGYFRPPDEAHEDAESMLPWARLAVEAARRARAEKDAKRRAKGRGAKGQVSRRPASGTSGSRRRTPGRTRR